MFCPDTPYDQYSGTFNTARIYLCHTTRTSLSTTFENNYSGNAPVLVLSRPSLALNWAENAWWQIGFDSAFNYNGTHNLLIEFRWSTAPAGALITCTTDPAAHGDMWAYGPASTSGSLRSCRSVLRLHFTAPSGWDAGNADLGNGWRWLSWFGYYMPVVDNWIWHNGLGYLYAYPQSTPQFIYFWNSRMQSWAWTSSTTYPYLYRFSDGVWLWYQPGSINPCWLYNFSTHQWESF